MSHPSVAEQLFFTEPMGRFALGHVFRTGQEVASEAPGLRDTDIGYWKCDIEDGNRLTWSTKVFELFDFAPDQPVDRQKAVERYSPHSRSVLDRLRSFALNHKCGFILDASLGQQGQNMRWIRVLAVPILDNDKVVGLQGLKRAL